MTQQLFRMSSGKCNIILPPFSLTFESKSCMVATNERLTFRKSKKIIIFWEMKFLVLKIKKFLYFLKKSFSCVSGKQKRKVKKAILKNFLYFRKWKFLLFTDYSTSTYLIHHLSRKQSVRPHMVASISTTCTVFAQLTGGYATPLVTKCFPPNSCLKNNRISLGVPNILTMCFCSHS